MKPTLVILAAGMGSRYGGLKQIDKVGSGGEAIIDFTMYDAIKTGFKKIVLIIRKEHEELFEENLIKHVRPFVEVEYAYQDLNDIPEGLSVPEGREKPWGTTHALLACRNIVKEDPFVICNADDFYGRNAFEKVMAFFKESTDDKEYCMCGYRLYNTLSDNGTVTRGFCENKDGYLSNIKEVMQIKKDGDKAAYLEDDKWISCDPNVTVSMNFWGFKPSIFASLNELFINFPASPRPFLGRFLQPLQDAPDDPGVGLLISGQLQPERPEGAVPGAPGGPGRAGEKRGQRHDLPPQPGGTAGRAGGGDRSGRRGGRPSAPPRPLCRRGAADHPQPGPCHHHPAEKAALFHPAGPGTGRRLHGTGQRQLGFFPAHPHAHRDGPVPHHRALRGAAVLHRGGPRLQSPPGPAGAEHGRHPP